MAEVQVQSESQTPTGWVFTVLVRAGAPAPPAIAPPAIAPPAIAPPAPAPPAAARGPAPPGPAAAAEETTRHEVSLSWVDYEHWSHGRLAPEHVVRAVIESLIDAQWLPLPPRFDASTARRWVAHLDDAVRARL